MRNQVKTLHLSNVESQESKGVGSAYRHSRHKNRRPSRTPQTGGGTSSLSVCQLKRQEEVLQITFRFKSARSELGKKVFVPSFQAPFAWDLVTEDWKQTDLTSMSTFKLRPRVLEADSTSLNSRIVQLCSVSTPVRLGWNVFAKVSFFFFALSEISPG